MISKILIPLIAILEVQADIFWEQVLTNDLTSNIEKFNPGVGPWTPQAGKNQSRTRINVQLEIYGIKEVDIMSSTVKLSSAFRQWWNDSRMEWDPKDYGGIEQIYLKTDGSSPAGWMSDLIIREDAGEGLLSNMKFTDQRCKYTGLCYHSRIGEIAVQTTFDLERFPYDNQHVQLTIESWVHDASRIQVGLHTIPMKVQEPSSFVAENIEWEIIQNNSYEVFQDYGGSGAFYRVIYTITIQRQGATMIVAILIPGAMITFLGLMYYILPLGTGDRINYLATILLTEVMFLVMITSSVPLSKSTPELGWLFLGYTVLLAAIMFGALFIDKLSQFCNAAAEHAEKLQHKEEKLRKHLHLYSKQDFSYNTRDRSKMRNIIRFSANKTAEDQFESMAGDKSQSSWEINVSSDRQTQQEIKKMKPKQDKKSMKNMMRIIKLLDLSLFVCSIIAFVILSAIKFSVIF